MLDRKEILKRIRNYGLSWTSPSEGSKESMPLGSGVVAANVWIEKDGLIHLFLARSDCWAENGQLLKAGKVEIQVLEDGSPITQLLVHQLILEKGTQRLLLQGASEITLDLWVDPNRPILCLEAQSKKEVALKIRAPLLRPERRELKGQERHTVTGLEGEPDWLFVEPDAYGEAGNERICWFHQNERSVWENNLKHQEIPGWSDQGKDPLLGRIFGGCVGAVGAVKSTQEILVTEPGTDQLVCVALDTSQGLPIEHWQEQVGEALNWGLSQPGESRNAAEAWWTDFWTRSYFFAEGSAEGRALTQGYLFQKYLLAAAGRGPYPIKFNGSLFTADWEFEKENYNGDYRRWGCGYWFQNTRLIYWAMLPMGMREIMDPYFRLYEEVLPLALYRCDEYFSHPGAFLPETMNLWGGYLNTNYGYEREGLPKGVPVNKYIRYYYVGILELTLLGVEAYRYDPDPSFLEDWLQPMAAAFLNFYDYHYPRDNQGKLVIYPAEALETYQDAKNPAPEIAGLRRLIPELLKLGVAASRQQEDQWKQLLEAVPELPEAEGKLLPAEEIYEDSKNLENPELYAVFPFRLYGVGKPDLEMARRSFVERKFKLELGWHQDPIQAACLGLENEAFAGALKCLSTPYEKARFPGFWGPNYDWVPDMDQGSVGLITVHSMLTQWEGKTLYLGPAWPESEDCQFKFHGPDGIIIEGRVQEGQLRHCLKNANPSTVRVIPCLDRANQ